MKGKPVAVTLLLLAVNLFHDTAAVEAGDVIRERSYTKQEKVMETLNKVSDEMPAASQADVAEEVNFALLTLASTPFSEYPSAASWGVQCDCERCQPALP